jgi:DNA-binding NarL/FixJ family response regulator
LHGYLLGRPAETAAERRAAAKQYERFLASAADAHFWDERLRQQIYLGNEAFVSRMQRLAQAERLAAPEVPTAQRRGVSSLTDWLQAAPSRREGAFNAYTRGGFTMKAIALELGISVPAVSLMVKRVEQNS